MKISKIKGTNDLFGCEMAKYRYIEDTARQISKEFGFSEMQTPVFEATEVFSRSAGETSDVVNKEMYTFLDRGEKSLTLRPEGTAGISRSYVENKLYVEPGLRKIFYFEPMFRCERPQAGRFRQFTQFGVEAIGDGSPALDADIINLGQNFLNRLGIKNVKVLINTIGSTEGRIGYINKIKEYFGMHIDTMCEDCKKRLLTNPLRILDCKVDKNSSVMKNAPKILDYLSVEDKTYFSSVLKELDNLNIKYEVDQNLVRGLDYYNHVVFEFVYADESSPIYNLAILAGGRYNGLSKCFDGPDTPAIGFGSGVERISAVLDELGLFNDYKNEVTVCVMNIGEENKTHSLSLANFLRNNHISCDLDYVSNNLKPQFKLSERINSRYLLIIGTDEVENNVVKIKDTTSKEEKIIDFMELNKIFNIEGEIYAYKK